MDEMGLPYEWVLCPHCGAQSWRIPPHALDPCPLVVQATEALGLKFDAERTSWVRAGVHMEELTRVMREHMEGEEE